MEAYLVLGPESSGTRYFTSLLIDAGCAGSSEHEQPFDTELPRPAEACRVVWRRSFPHGDTNPDLLFMSQRLFATGRHSIRAFVMMRDNYAMAASQAANQHAPNISSAYVAIEEAYETIFDQIRVLHMPFQTVQYELLGDDLYLARLLGWYELPFPHSRTPFVNGNTKHY